MPRTVKPILSEVGELPEHQGQGINMQFQLQLCLYWVVFTFRPNLRSSPENSVLEGGPFRQLAPSRAWGGHSPSVPSLMSGGAGVFLARISEKHLRKFV